MNIWHGFGVFIAIGFELLVIIWSLYIIKRLGKNLEVESTVTNLLTVGVMGGIMSGLILVVAPDLVNGTFIEYFGTSLFLLMAICIISATATLMIYANQHSKKK